MKTVVIPTFSDETQEAAWWDAHRSELEAEIRQRIRQEQQDLHRSTASSGFAKE
jgi:hypothetical protein